MTLPVVDDVAKVVVRGHIGSHLMENVLHVRCTSPLTQIEAQSIGDDLASNFFDSFVDSLNGSCGFDNMEVYDLATHGGPQYTILPATFPVIGNGDEGALPPSAALCVALRGATGGRSGRGRMYVGGFDEDASAGDSAEPTTVSAVQAAADDLVANVDLVIVSYYSGTDKTQTNKRNVPIQRVTPVVTDVATAIVRAEWCNQRRRSDIK